MRLKDIDESIKILEEMIIKVRYLKSKYGKKDELAEQYETELTFDYQWVREILKLVHRK